MDALLEAMLEAPDVVKKMDSVREVLAEEHARRLLFYEEMTEAQKTEFINGEVIVHSPAKWQQLGASGNLFLLLSAHVNRNALGAVTTEKALVSLTRNDYEPDICFFRREVANTFVPTQMHLPAPDFIAEVLSPSTERIDRGVKKQDYAAHGVGEYWIVDTDAQALEQYVLTGNVYQSRGTWKEEELIASAVVTGFQVPVRAIFDRRANMEALAHLLSI